jgi:hypothetical protein
MYQVLSEYSFEELVEYVIDTECLLTKPKFETFMSFNKSKYSKLKKRILKNKIILQRPRSSRRGFQWNFVIKASKQAQGTLLKGRFAMPADRLVGGILFYALVISLFVFGMLNLDNAFPTQSMTDLGKILLLAATCCWGCAILTVIFFGGRYVYRQGEKEVLEYFRTMGTEIKTKNSFKPKRRK